MNNAPLKTFLIIFPVIIALGVILFVQINRKSKETPINKIPAVISQTPAEEPLTGGDKDEHGCIGSAGYTWCEVKQKCLRPWEEICEINASDSQSIKAALAIKNNWNPAEIKITIAKNDGQYAMGGASNETAQENSRLWFAAKVDGEWKIVWDANETITCDQLDDYQDFPTDLIPECYDSPTNTMLKR